MKGIEYLDLLKKYSEKNKHKLLFFYTSEKPKQADFLVKYTGLDRDLVKLKELILNNKTKEINYIKTAKENARIGAYVKKLGEEAKNLKINNKILYEFKKFKFNEIKRYIVNSVISYNFQKCDAVISIQNGGSVPALIAKHKINELRNKAGLKEIFMYPIGIKKTSSDSPCSNSILNKAQVLYYNKPQIFKKQARFLLVEDLIAYGDTLEKAKAHIKKDFPGCKVKFEVLSIILNIERFRIRNKKIPKNFHYYKMTKDHEWVIFPWESNPNKKRIIK